MPKSLSGATEAVYIRRSGGAVAPALQSPSREVDTSIFNTAMDFKLLVAVVCLASIRYSEAQISFSPASVTTSVCDSAASGTTVSYTAPTISGNTGTTAYTGSAATPSTEIAFVSNGVLVTSATPTGTSYSITVTATDSTSPTPLTGTYTVTVTVTANACSGAEALIPSMAVIFIALLGLLFKKN